MRNIMLTSVLLGLGSSHLAVAPAFSADAIRPPAALSSVHTARASEDVVIARVVSGRTGKDGSLYFGILAEQTVRGELKRSCARTSQSMKVGAKYVFFPTTNSEDECVDAGKAILRAIEIVTFEGEEYVAFIDTKYLYPGPASSVTTVSGELVDGTGTVVNWSGMPLIHFLKLIDNNPSPLKNPRPE